MSSVRDASLAGGASRGAAPAALETPHEYAKARERLTRRAAVILGAIFFSYAAIWITVAWYQLGRRQALEAISPAFQPRFREPAGQPGDILDDRGRVLATSVQVFDVKVDPPRFREDLKKPGELQAAVGALSKVLGVPEAKLWPRVESSASWQYLARRVSPAVERRLIAAIDAGKPRIPYITTEATYRREYPLGATACYALGWRGVDDVARCGLEQTYDFLLTGEPGSAVGSRDKYGRLILWPSVKKPVAARPGRSVVLTLDADIQQATEVALDHLMAAHTPKMSAALVMDPRTGRVLAMAAKPGFDPNWFSGAGESHPVKKDDLLNPIVNFGFEPGSVMKVFTIAAALDAGKTNLQEVFICHGYLPDVGGYPLICADGKAHGRMHLPEVLAKSCNISAARIAMRMGGPAELAALRRFGFGRPTRLGFASEGYGALPPGPGQKVLRIRDLANLGFGQGMSATLIQVAAGYCGLVNGGVYMQPYIVDRVLNQDGSTFYKVPPVAERRVCSVKTSRELRSMLKLVVDTGTGRRARIAGVKVGGKTGTAQVPGPKGYIPGAYVSDFVMVLPSDHPRYVIAVMALEPHNGHHGGDVAAPAAREIGMAVLRLHRELPAQAEVAKAPMGSVE